MERYWERFLREHRGAFRRHDSNCLGAFGKHPGWNDHIDDIGLETESLLIARQLIYVDGIGRQLAMGAWESLADGERLSGFNHALLWFRGDACLTGRIWASSDGKGRSQFPMVICAHVTQAKIPRIPAAVLPTIETAEARCRATENADDVRAIVGEARKELQSAVASCSAAVSGSPQVAVDSHHLLQSVAGVVREAQKSASAYVRSILRSCRRAGSAHLRVPAVSADSSDNLGFWSAAMGSLFDPAAPILLLAPVDHEWIDVIVGEPSSRDLFCLRAGSTVLPVVAPADPGGDRKQLRKAERLLASLPGK